MPGMPGEPDAPAATSMPLGEEGGVVFDAEKREEEYLDELDADLGKAMKAAGRVVRRRADCSTGRSCRS